MHGGPGTGKTQVINIIKEELFEQVLKWHAGVHFHIVALQAVMADLLSGDTIHHTFNLPVLGKNGSKPSGDKSEINTMKAMLQFRLLIIDGISMVRAQFIAHLDTNMRSVARAVDPHAKDATNT